MSYITMSTDKMVIQEFILKKDNELRFEVESKNEKVYLTLKRGTAEVFGTELITAKTYEFTSGAKIAVFTCQGCILEVKGTTDVIYTATETPMMIYSNCHTALELMRLKAEKENTRGPITLLVGSYNVGKSTVCKILLNFAVRKGRTPIFVDLDADQGQISIPGTIGALVVERPVDIEEGFSYEATLLYNLGHRSPTSNVNLFSRLVDQLASSVKEKLKVDERVRASGAIINTCGWFKAEGYKQLLKTIQAFEADAIIVLDEERLYSELVRDMPDFVKTRIIPKSGGVVQLSKSDKIESGDQRIREYFYGSPRITLYPYSFELKYSEIKIYKIGVPALPESCLPIGMKIDDPMTKLVLLTPNVRLLHQLLAVSFADTVEKVITSLVAGFVYVTSVDIKRQVMTVLSPQPRPLPTNILVLTELQFMHTL